MIVRIWNVGIAEGKMKALDDFANNVSLPMFKKQEGCLGVIFTKSGNTCSTITIWESMKYIQNLDRSESYNNVVTQIENSCIIEGTHSTESYESYGGFVSQNILDSVSKREKLS